MVVLPVNVLTPERVQVLVPDFASESVLSPLEMTPEIALPAVVPPRPSVLAALLVPMLTGPVIERATPVGLNVAVPVPPAVRLAPPSWTVGRPEVMLLPVVNVKMLFAINMGAVKA